MPQQYNALRDDEFRTDAGPTRILVKDTLLFSYHCLYGKLHMSETIMNSYIGLSISQFLGLMTAKRTPER